MQTTASSLRPSYQYHHDYGRLGVECQQPNATGLDETGTMNGGSGGADQLLLLQHQNQHHQDQHQPQFIQLDNSGYRNHLNLCYENDQHVLVYGSDQPEIDTYSQVSTGQTTAVHQGTDPLTSHLPSEIAYQQMGVVEHQSMYYDHQTVTSCDGGESSSALDEVHILRQSGQAAIYCKPHAQLPTTELKSLEPDVAASSCHLDSAYSYHHGYSQNQGQQMLVLGSNHQSNLTDEKFYGENCVPIELQQQQIYQNLDESSEKQHQHQHTTMDGNLNMDMIAAGAEKSINFDYNHCYTADPAQQTIGSSFGGNSNNVDVDHQCLMASLYADVEARRLPHSSAASSISDSSSEESSDSTLTRDEKRAREANLPMSYQEIVNLSIDQFNEQLARHSLTEEQLQLIKDIRRRGKNKVAAQSCRKRKMEQIYELQHEVNDLANKRLTLEHECDQLAREYERLVQDYDSINAILQQKLQQRPQPLATCANQNTSHHLPNTC